MVEPTEMRQITRCKWVDAVPITITESATIITGTKITGTCGGPMAARTLDQTGAKRALSHDSGRDRGDDDPNVTS
jgi:hypothetical protein